jgi:hypothetical protein
MRQAGLEFAAEPGPAPLPEPEYCDQARVDQPMLNHSPGGRRYTQAVLTYADCMTKLADAAMRLCR